ncbi:MAG TPA: ATP-dependent DNA helicase UvrD2 [Cellulomonas sp.]
MSPDDLLDALDPDQREVALALTGPVCVLAGAGTGKTRAITHRIAYGVRTGVYAPTSVLAVTFTARAAGEMRTRLRDLGVAGVQARTFHAAALRQLRYFWPRVVGGPLPEVLGQKAPVVADACHRLGLAVDRVSVRDLASEIECAKVSRITAEDYVRAAADAGRPAPAGHDPQTIARLITAYEDAKDARHVMDMEDILWLLAGMLVENGAVADEVRGQYRRFVVDEYQDISPLQKFLLEQWLGGRDELCVVGDPSQTIYSFAGATPHYLTRFTAEHPKAQVVRLVRDYRSTPQVVGLANEVLRRAPRGATRWEPLELIAQRPSGSPVRFAVYDDDEAEAAGVATRASRLIAAGTRPSEIAVLYRTNAQSEAFEQALANIGIGYVLRGGERFFARREVRDAIVRLRGAAVAADADTPMTVTVRDALRSAGWSDEPPAARGASRERWDTMQALVALADDLAAAAERTGTTATVSDLVADLDERAAAQHAPTVEGVTLASLHAAKGLEWDAVFLAGLSDGLLPFASAESAADLAEERRLLYVGITRARQHLELSHGRARNPGGRANRRRSRFLDGLWPQEGRARFGDGRVRSVPRLTGEVDAALLEALHAWRADLAKRTSKPTYTVLGDATLSAIAELKPASVPELARVQGIGPAKIDRYGPDLLALVAGRTTAATEA